MTKPERGQIPFIFEPRRDPTQFYYELGFVGQENPEGAGRFVRKLRESVQVRTPNQVAYHLMNSIFTPFDAFDQEEIWSLLLDTKNQITHEAMIYRGTVNTVYIRQAELFKEAVRVNAPGIILSHVHPSGQPEPSPEDVIVTQEAVEVGRILGIEVLDHLVIGRDVWVSMKERRLGFS